MNTRRESSPRDLLILVRPTRSEQYRDEHDGKVRPGGVCKRSQASPNSCGLGRRHPINDLKEAGYVLRRGSRKSPFGGVYGHTVVC